MKIRDVRAYHPRSPEAPADWRSSLGQILVAIETSDGLIGYGVGGGGPASVHVIRGVFRELAERRLHQILQPDVTWCGGMTELVKIYAIAVEHGLKVCPHRGAEAWALHAIAALEPSDPLPEAGRKWITWLQGQPQPDRGWITVPTQPGFGVDVDETELSYSQSSSS